MLNTVDPLFALNGRHYADMLALCQNGQRQPVQSYLVLLASLASKHKNKPPVALSITRTTRLFFNTADAKCVDKMRVTDHIVPIATWMLTRIKVHIKGE